MGILIKIFALIILIFSSFVLYDRADMRTPIPFEAMKRINPIPETLHLIDENKYLEAQEYLAFFMRYKYMQKNQDAKDLLRLLKEKRASSEYKVKSIAQGVLTGKSNEMEGMISAGISDLFLFGDLRDLSIEGFHHLKGEKVDKVLVALSTIGVATSGATLISAGTSAPIKGSISFLKYARKSKALPTWLGKYLIKASKTKSLKSIKPLFEETQTLIKSAGMGGGLKLLVETKDFNALKRATSFSKIYGKRSGTLIKILGKDAMIYQKGFSKKTFLYASTYGKVGVKRLMTLGEKGFLKSMIRPLKSSRLLKVFDKHSVVLLKQIPDKIFYLLGFVAVAILV